MNWMTLLFAVGVLAIVGTQSGLQREKKTEQVTREGSISPRRKQLMVF
jgi:hypothetical protein